MLRPQLMPLLKPLDMVDGITYFDLSMIQLLCTVLTIGFFCTGILTSRKIYMAKSVQNVNFLPYVMTSLNCLLWASYGLTISDGTQILVNVTGAMLQAVYIFIYFKYLNDFEQLKEKLKLLVAAFLALALVAVFIKGFSNSSNKVENLGITCDVFTILMFASPLSTLRRVIMTKNTATISLPLSIMVCLVSISWFSYGVMIKDIYVKVPNAMGLILGVIQVSLFCIYPSNGKSLNI